MSKRTDKATETDANVSSAAPNAGEPGQEFEQKRTDTAGSDSEVDRQGAESGGDEGAGGHQDAQATEQQEPKSETADQEQAERRNHELQQRVAELEGRVVELENENSELKERYLRKQADFENYRKRMQREKEELGAYANKQLLLDLVPVIDDFERAIESAKESRDFDSFYEGVVLIEKQMTEMLERKWGLQRFESEGEEFDPQKHEAVTAEHTGEGTEPMVVEDYQKGYMLHDRVLRSAKVKVAMPAPKAEADRESDNGNGDKNGSSDAEGRGSSDSAKQ